MRRGLFIALASAALAAGAATATPRVARADDPPPSADRLKSAAEEYDRGRRAFLADDFDGAAVHFESAYRDAPRAETIRLAIRARRKAKQLGRAATLAAIALQRFTTDAATAQLAKETLDEAGPALAEYDIDCNGECAIAADGRVVSQSDAPKHRIFLEPGPHDLGVSFKQGGLTKHIEAKRGGKDALSFDAPPPPPDPAITPPGTTPDKTRPGEKPETSSKPLSPVVFFVAAGVTVALGAATIVSGIDAKNNPGTDAVHRACAGKDESCPEYQAGKSAETRTNVFLGATIGVAVITGVIGVFFTRWSAAPVQVGAAPLPGGGTIGAIARF